MVIIPNKLRILDADAKLADNIKKGEVTPENASVPAVAEKKVDGRGRPKSRTDCKLASFHLSQSLIDKIAEEAAIRTGRNKSALVELAFDVYFASLKKADNDVNS